MKLKVFEVEMPGYDGGDDADLYIRWIHAPSIEPVKAIFGDACTIAEVTDPIHGANKHPDFIIKEST